MSKLSSSDRERLSGLLEETLGLFEQILENCEQQSRQLDKEEYEGLEASLTNSEALREKINGLHQESSTLMQSYVSSADTSLNGLIGQINEKTALCAKLNSQNMELLRSKTQEHSKKIDDHRAKREGIGGYAQVVSNKPELFDKNI